MKNYMPVFFYDTVPDNKGQVAQSNVRVDGTHKELLECSLCGFSDSHDLHFSLVEGIKY